MKICPMGAKLLHADRGTEERTDWCTEGQTWLKLVVAYRNSTKTPKERSSRTLSWWSNKY